MKINIPVATIENKSTVIFIEWDCEKTEIPGLVVHKEIVRIDGEIMPRKKVNGQTYYWAVTHQASGIAVIKGLSKEQAHKAAQELGGLDWTVDARTLKKDKRYGKLVKSVKEVL